MTRSVALKSASFRLIAIFTLIVTIISSLAMAVQYRGFAKNLERLHQKALKADLNGFAALYDQRRIVALRQSIEFRALSDAQGDTVLFLQDRNATKLAGNLESWPADIPAQAGLFDMAGLRNYTQGARTYTVAARVLPGGFGLLVGRDRTALDQALASQKKTALFWLALIILCGMGLGTLFVRRILVRISRVNRLAETVRQGDMAARLPSSEQQDEFAQLDRHINAMLDRIERLHRAKLRISDAIAHELRTPLNRIHQQIDAIPTEDQHKLLIQNEISRTIRIFDALLDISSAESQEGDHIGMTELDLSALCGEIVDLYRPLSEDKHLDLRAEITADLYVLGDRSLLAQLLANLLDNAIKFTRPNDQVTVELVPRGGHVVLQIRDTGPGLGEDIGETLFEKFVRSERDSEADGHGLGLALVHAIATRHGAKIKVLQPQLGFAIEVVWSMLSPSESIPEPGHRLRNKETCRPGHAA